MADSAVNLGAGGNTGFGSMSMDEMIFGTSDPLEVSRRTRPSYDEYGKAFRIIDGEAQPFIDEEGYRVTLQSEGRTPEGHRMESEVTRASPYAGMAKSLYDMESEDMLPLLENGSIASNSIYGKSGSNVPAYVAISPDGSFSETPIGFEEGGEVDPLAGVSNDDKRRILRIGNNNVADLVDNDYKIYTILTDRQNKGLRNFAEFKDGGLVDLPTGIISNPDGEPIDNLRYATPKEFEEGTYRHLQNLQQRMSEHLAASQNPVTTQAGVPMQANPETMRYHQEQAEELREEIDDFSTRRAEAILSYPERFQGLGSDSFAGDAPVFITSDDPVIRNFADGGEVPIEEAGIMSALLDPRIDLPSRDYQDMVRASGREGSEGSSIYYSEGSPTFEQVLETKYGYPDDVDRGEFYNTTEAMRAERPRHDMPTYQELEDARAHALMSAELARDVGPNTAEKVGGLGEMLDRYMPVLGTATDADVAMDKRNNAFGANLLRKAGVQASPQQLTKMVDQAVFDQLDVVLGRAPGERRFKSPDSGIDIFFPRDKQGFFDINRYD